MTNILFRPQHKNRLGDNNKVFYSGFNSPGHQFINNNWHRVSTVYSNIQEFNDRFIVTLAVPGYDKSGITISLEENRLKIAGNNDVSSERKFLMKEFDFSSFERAFYLPEDVQKDKIEATVENGILQLVIYKAEVKPAINVSIK